MRLVAVMLPPVFLCATGLSQTIPVNMGLWKVTTRTEATVPSELTAAMKKDGLTGEPLLPMRTVSPPVIQKAKSCMNEAQWVKDEAVVAKAPQNCILVSRSRDAQGMSDRLKCNAGGMSMVIENKLSWMSREKIHLASHTEISYPGVASKGVWNIEVTSVFLSPKCGSLLPGSSVPIGR